MGSISIISADTLPTRCDVLLLGDFDGIHLGHRALFNAAVGDSIVFTFSKNTKRTMGFIDATLYPEHINRYLMGTLGARCVYYADFDAIRDYSPERFVEYITSLFSPSTVVCGENFTFGKCASGDSRMLRELLALYGVSCTVVPSVELDGTPISSSAVRKAVSEGDMHRARRLLGLPYFIKGKVVHGKSLGRRIGTPTVNLPIYDGCVVAKRGVYISTIEVDGRTYKGVTNIGVRPTVEDGDKINSETYLLDFDEELYDAEVTLFLWEYLREERKFEDTASLSRQILADSQKTIEFFELFTNC